MKLAGEHQFAAPVQEVYDRLLDPAVLRNCMPGCESLDAVGKNRFALVFSVPVPAIKGEYQGTVEIVDRTPPQAFRMRINAKGKSGFVTADARMTIEQNDEGSILRYDADAQVGGPAASVGQRVIAGISRRQVAQMMRCLDRAGEPQQPEVVAAPPAATQVGRRRTGGLVARIAAWLRSPFGRRR